MHGETGLKTATYNDGMLSAEARSRLCVVLVGARNPQNIGAAARAMQDFGFAELRVVNGYAPPFEAAQLEAKSAVGAGEVMRAARLFPDLAAAVADCTLIAGTTAIGGRDLAQPVQTLQDAAPMLVQALDEAAAIGATHHREDAATYGIEHAAEGTILASRVALLFGSEKTGLTREQLSFCSLLLTIPMFAPAARHLSMNLGQSVAVCLYELTRHGFEGSRELPVAAPLPATAQDRERLLGLLLETMEASDYARRFPANARVEVVRRITHRLGATADEAAMWMGLLRLVRGQIRRTSAPE